MEVSLFHQYRDKIIDRPGGGNKMSVSFFHHDKFIAHSTNNILKVLGIDFPNEKKVVSGPFEMTKGEAHPLKNGVSFVVISDGSCPLDERQSIETALQVLELEGIFPIMGREYEQDGQWVFLK